MQLLVEHAWHDNFLVTGGERGPEGEIGGVLQAAAEQRTDDPMVEQSGRYWASLAMVVGTAEVHFQACKGSRISADCLCKQSHQIL